MDMGRKYDTKESAPSTDNSLSFDRAVSEEAPAETDMASDTASDAAAGSVATEFAAKADGQQAQLKMNTDTNAAMSETEDSDTAAVDNGSAGTMGITSTEEATTAPMDDSAYSVIYTLSFRDICPILPEAAISVNITETSTNNSAFLSDGAAINEFYSLMDMNFFAEGSESSGVNDYIFKVNSSGASFTMTVEDNYILTSYSFGEEKTDSRYVTANHQQLLQDLGAFYNKFKQ
jgi:hypothetical protein